MLWKITVELTFENTPNGASNCRRGKGGGEGKFRSGLEEAEILTASVELSSKIVSCVHTHTHTRRHKHAHIYTYTHTHTHTHIHIYTRTHKYARAWTRTDTNG